MNHDDRSVVVDTPFDSAWQNELYHIVHQTKDRLPKQERLAIMLRLDGASDQEIDAKIGSGRAASAERQFLILLMERYKEDDFFE